MKRLCLYLILAIFISVSPLYGEATKNKSNRHYYKDEDKNGINDELQKTKKYYKKRIRKRYKKDYKKQDKKGNKKKGKNSDREENDKSSDTKR